MGLRRADARSAVRMPARRWLVALALGLLGAMPAQAHTPHDDVRDVVVSPAFRDDGTVYAIVRDNLLRSTDRGASWKRLVQGLDSRSSLLALAVSPNAPGRLFLSTQDDGVFRSDDAGVSWRRTAGSLAGLSLPRLHLPPSGATVVAFAADAEGGLYRTLDGGAQWSRVLAETAPITAIASLYWGTLAEGREVLVGTAHGELLRSADGGRAWQRARGFPGCGAITSLGTTRVRSLRDTYYVGTAGCGVWRTVDGGVTFVPVGPGIAEPDIAAVAMSSDDRRDATVYVATRSRAGYRSRDGGASWQRLDDGLARDAQAAALGEPDFRGLAVSPDHARDGTVFLAGFAGLFRSRSGGRAWHELQTLPLTLIQTVALSPAFDVDRTIIVATYRSGIFRSRDGGDRWERIAEHVENRNLDVAFSPAYGGDGTVFVGTAGDRVARSTDGGTTWTLQRLPAPDGPSMLALSPGFDADRTLFVGTRRGVVYRSTDAGSSFDPVYAEPLSTCGDCGQALALSPAYPRDATLLLATRTGLRTSRDGGATWAFHGGKSRFGERVSLAVSPAWAADGTAFAGGTAGLFRTTDGALTWWPAPVSTPAGDEVIEALALSPAFAVDRTMLVSVRGRGLFRSLDGGGHFEPVGGTLLRNNHAASLWSGFPATSSPIRFSPAFAVDRTVYATSSDRLLRSRDAGLTWQVVLVHGQLR